MGNLWKRFCDILKRSWTCYRDNLNSQRASTLAYCTLFAIVPLVALLFGITKGFRSETILQESLCARFPNQQPMLQWIYTFAGNTLERTSGSVVAGIGIVVLLWSGYILADTVETSFAAIWNLPRRRSVLYRFNSYFTILFLAPLLMMALSSIEVWGNSLICHFLEERPGIGSVMTPWYNLSVSFFPFLVTVAVFFLIYFFIPNTKVRWWPALLAAILAGCVYQLVQELYIIAQRKIFSYNQVFDNFAVLPLFLIWVQWAWQIVLFGAEISFVTQTLDTGRFDQKPNHFTTLLQQQLAVAKIIFCNIHENRGMTKREELQTRLGITETEITRAVEALEQAKLIAGDKETGFLPTASSEITLFECICRLRGDDSCKWSEEIERECAQLKNAFQDLQEAEKTVSNDIKLYQL
ncbi:MAG: YihY/virulence factor BrkB family protein [Victivallaceae bacterium]|nr:YihY/virulence factor BrkB family protein [Victivallaceae bacterium]